MVYQPVAERRQRIFILFHRPSRYTLALIPWAPLVRKQLTKNPLGLKFHELDAAQLPRTLEDVTASVINTNFAGEAGLVPARDALVMEGSESPYANIVVVRNEDKDSPKAKALMKAVQSPEVKAYIQKNLVERGIVPVF